jgi:P-aminobenzoate N-oxygenase AurF.
MGPEAIRFIQVQALYHYLQGIANIELDIINDSHFQLYKNHLGMTFPVEMQLESLCVIVDESYHALVAIDLLNQVKTFTGITVAKMPEMTEVSYAVERVVGIAPESVRELVRMSCVCLSEQVLTSELINILNNEDLFPSFYHVMKDHVSDEGRHAKFSQRILNHIWDFSSEDMKSAIAVSINHFMENYANNSIAENVDEAILRALNIDEVRIAEIIAETYPEPSDHLSLIDNPSVKKMVLALDKAGISAYLPVHNHELVRG